MVHCQTVPSYFRASRSVCPAAMAVTPLRPGTWLRWYAPLPQTCTVPSYSSAAEKLKPAATETASSPSTSTGSFSSEEPLCPS